MVIADGTRRAMARGGGNPGGNPEPDPGPDIPVDPQEPDPPNPPNPPNPIQVVNVPQPVQFALTPAQAVTGIIDFYGREGQRIYSSATKTLEEERYDCLPDGFYQFIATLKMRASEYAWDDPNDGVLMIPTDYRHRATPMTHMLDEYGTLDILKLRGYETTYIAQATRRAQDNRLLFQCLMNSISKEGKKKLLIWEKEYTVKVGGKDFKSGILFLKVVIRESHLDTNATTSMVRHKLSNLDTYVATIGNDITKFNAYVRILVDSLSARGEETSDLLVNLFKGYGACSDKSFVDYIRRKQERYDEGGTLSVNELMNFADTKFKQLKDKEIWEAPSSEEEKLLALETKVTDLRKRLTKARDSKTIDPKARRPAGNKTPGPPSHPTKRQKLEKPKWMFDKPPEADLRKPKEWNGKPWYYCSPITGGKCSPGQYRCHKPSECKGTAIGKDGGKKKEKKVVIQEALTQTLDQEEDYESN
jgi:hypothetical protein